MNQTPESVDGCDCDCPPEQDCQCCDAVTLRLVLNACLTPCAPESLRAKIVTELHFVALTLSVNEEQD